MGFVGSQFTWQKHFVDYTVWERLDRIVATNDWFNLFPNTKIHHLDMTSSNHKPLLIWSADFRNLSALIRCGCLIKAIVIPLKRFGGRENLNHLPQD